MTDRQQEIIEPVNCRPQGGGLVATSTGYKPFNRSRASPRGVRRGGGVAPCCRRPGSARVYGLRNRATIWGGGLHVEEEHVLMLHEQHKVQSILDSQTQALEGMTRGRGLFSLRTSPRGTFA